MKKLNIIIITLMIILLTAIVIAECEIINTQTFINMDRADIINKINLTFVNKEITPTDLYINFEMKSVTNNQENYCMSKIRITTKLSFELIDYCKNNYPTNICFQQLIIRDTNFTILNDTILVEPINYQLKTKVEQEIDNILEQQLIVSNYQTIQELSNASNYTLPVIE